MGRPTHNPDYKERFKELNTFKLQLSITDDVQALVEGFVKENPWAERRPFITLLRAGRMEHAKEWLDRDINLFDPKQQPQNMNQALAAFGIDRKHMGDPEDKIRREEYKKKFGRKKLSDNTDRK